jgi:hypothetical protein
MRAKGLVCAVALCAAAFLFDPGAASVEAQTPRPPAAIPPGPGDPSSPARPQGFSEIRDALVRIAAALERTSQRQDLDLSLKAADLRLRRLGDLEGQLHEQQARRRELESQRVDLEAKVGRFVRRNKEKDLGLSSSEVDDAADAMRSQIRELKEQVSEIDQTVAQLENEVASRRIEIDQALQQLDRRIDARQ